MLRPCRQRFADEPLFHPRGLTAKLGKRSFGDKGEWAQALAVLQQEGVLTHIVDSDTITLPDAA